MKAVGQLWLCVTGLDSVWLLILDWVSLFWLMLFWWWRAEQESATQTMRSHLKLLLGHGHADIPVSREEDLAWGGEFERLKGHQKLSSLVLSFYRLGNQDSEMRNITIWWRNQDRFSWSPDFQPLDFPYMKGSFKLISYRTAFTPKAGDILIIPGLWTIGIPGVLNKQGFCECFAHFPFILAWWDPQTVKVCEIYAWSTERFCSLYFYTFLISSPSPVL